MAAFDVAQGHLFGTVFEAALYGIYFTLFIACLIIFTTKRAKHTKHNKVILATICVMFILSTMHLGGTIQSLQAGFFDVRPTTPEKYFNSKAIPLNIFNKSVYATNMIVGDALMIYRLWVVYQGNLWVITPPTLLMLGTGASVYLLCWEFAQLKPGVSAFAVSIKQLALAVFALPLTTNLMITTLIVFRIWQARRRCKRANFHKDVSLYHAILANTVESCVLYPAMLIVTLALYSINSNGQDVLTGPMTQLISIVPTLLWMQVRLGFSRYDAAVTANHDEDGKTMPIALSFARPPGFSSNDHAGSIIDENSPK